MAAAAHVAVVSVSTDDVSYNEVDGLNDASLQRMLELLDTTDFKDTSGEKTLTPGLGDGSVSLSGDYEPADTNGQVVLRTAGTGKSLVYVKVLSDGTNGYKAGFYVESFDIKASVGGKAEFSCSLKKSGALTAVP